MKRRQKQPVTSAIQRKTFHKAQCTLDAYRIQINRTHENFIKTKNGRDFFHNPERQQESFPDELQRIKPSQD
jgi:hypothetical protein